MPMQAHASLLIRYQERNLRAQGEIFDITDLDHTSGDDGMINLVTPGFANKKMDQDGDDIDIDSRFPRLGQSKGIPEMQRAPAKPYVALNRDVDASLNNLASAIQARFNEAGDRADLEAAIRYSEEALELLPPSHSRRLSSLNKFFIVIEAHFNHTRERSHLGRTMLLTKKPSVLHTSETAQELLDTSVTT
ncbi:hypothetical protein FRB98_002298 [Tulasnella sp. 332]|nr:hypothetical protein FRB98_002298 [Tulasnella sp. 332]